MATVTIELPDVLSLGRNGQIGKLPVDWSRVPQHVLDHVGGVYFTQYLTDAANAGGADTPMSERLDAAKKKLANMYAGLIRRVGLPGMDPIESVVFARAKRVALGLVRKTPEYTDADGKGLERVENALAARAKPTTLDAIIAYLIGQNPDWRDDAERELADNAAAAEVDLDELGDDDE